MSTYKPTSTDFNDVELSSDPFAKKALRLGLRDPAIGVGKFAQEFINTLEGPLNIPRTAYKKIREKLGHPIPERKQYDIAKILGQEAENTQADEVIQQVFQFAPSLFIPEARLGKFGSALESIPKFGKYIKSAVGNALPQAAFSASQNKNDALKSAGETAAVVAPFSALSVLAKSPSPNVRRTVKTISALAAGYGGHKLAEEAGASDVGQDAIGLISAALGGRGFKSKKKIAQELSEGVSDYKPRLDAAKRLNLSYLTPAEASLNPFVATKQGALGKTPEGAKLLYEKGQQRVESEKNSIKGVIDSVYNEDTHGPKVKKYYEEANETPIPEEFTDKFKDNKIIRRAERIVNNKPAYQESLKDVPKNSFVYWDLVKRALDDMIQSSPDAEARILSSTKKDLVNGLDSFSPEYKKGRNLYERQFVRKELEKAFDKKEITGLNFYKALASDSNFSKIMHSLRNAPEAQSKLKDMKMLFKDLIPTPSVRTASALEKTNMTKERNFGNFAESFIKNVFTGGAADKAAIEFITSPNWDKQLKQIESINNKQQKAAKFIEIFGKALGQYAGKSN